MTSGNVFDVPPGTDMTFEGCSIFCELAPIEGTPFYKFVPLETDEKAGIE